MALGIVLQPFGKVPGAFPTGIVYANESVRAGYLCPEDPFFNTRGEVGRFYDTYLGGLGHQRRWPWWKRRRVGRYLNGFGLGAIPTDAELSIVRGYTPVESGWIPAHQNGQKAFITGPWHPPSGKPPGGYPIPVAFNGLGEVPIGVTASGDANATVAALNAHNDRVFSLMLISTTAVALSALITVFRTIRLIQTDKRGE